MTSNSTISTPPTLDMILWVVLNYRRLVNKDILVSVVAICEAVYTFDVKPCNSFVYGLISATAQVGKAILHFLELSTSLPVWRQGMVIIYLVALESLDR